MPGGSIASNGISDFSKFVAEKDPTAKIYAMDLHSASNLGLDHLIDELSNSLDTTSGLPDNLRLTPEGLGGLSMEEALRKVHGINQFRAEKAKKANARFAAAEGIPVYKEYPEGYRWLEYKAGDLPDGWVEKDGYVYAPDGSSKESMRGGDPRYAQVADWLKQEGDTMGHCVGGYCDPVAARRDAALAMGATHAFDPGAVNLGAEIMALTGNIGVDYAFETAGVAKLIESSLALTRSGGTTVCVGAPPRADALHIAPAAAFLATGKRIVATLLGGCNSLREIPRLVSLLRAGRLDLEGLVTARRPLEEVNEGFADLAAGRGIRTVLRISDAQAGRA